MKLKKEEDSKMSVKNLGTVVQKKVNNNKDTLEADTDECIAIKYFKEYVEEDDTEIKMEPVSVKTEPYLKTESIIKTKPEDDTKIKLEPFTIKSEPFFKDESDNTEPVRSKQEDRKRREKEEPQILLGLGRLQLEEEQLDWVFTLFKKRISEDRARAKYESRPPSTEFIIHFADLSLEEEKRQSEKEAKEKERERIAQENQYNSLIQDKYIQNFKQQRLKIDKNSQMIGQNIQRIENHLTSIETLSDAKNISIPEPQRRMLFDLRGDLAFFESNSIVFSFNSFLAQKPQQQVFTWIFETQKKERMQQFKKFLIKTNQQDCLIILTDMEVSMRNIFSCFGDSFNFPTKNINLPKWQCLCCPSTKMLNIHVISTTLKAGLGVLPVLLFLSLREYSCKCYTTFCGSTPTKVL